MLRNFAMPDPPIDLPPAAHALWQRVYRQARRAWVGSLADYHEEDAQLTANVAVVGWFSKQGGAWHRRHYSSGAISPVPGSTFVLGEFEDVEAVEQTGAFVRHAFTPDRHRNEAAPLLIWSQDLKAAFCFPNLKLGPCSLSLAQRESRLVAMWNEGRRARCAAPANFPRARMGAPIPAIAISYYSDKFKKNGKHTWQHYIHHFEGDVTVSLSSGAVPDVLMVRGGKLRVTPSGLEG